MLLTLKQFAQLHSIPLRRAQSHAKLGVLPSQRISIYYLIDTDDFAQYQKNLAYLAQRKVEFAARATKARMEKFVEKSGK